MLGRGLRVIVTWLIVVSFLVGFIPITSQVSADPDPNNLKWPDAGAVNLTKTAVPTKTQGEWEVTLTVEGKNIQSTTDVVLVIDKSGSMAYNGPGTTGGKSYGKSPDNSKMTKAKAAANQFVDSLLQPNSTTRVAVISFSDVANKISDFTDVNNKDALNTAINNISPNGGTNIQAGIHQASELLKNSSANNKFIVLLSDGQPTYSFKAKHAGNYTFPSGSTFTKSLKDFDYSTRGRIGSGGNYTFSSYTVDGVQVKDNGIGTVSEAKLAQDQDIHMYSIGLDVANDPIATNVLTYTQDKGYIASSGADLKAVFNELSSKIAYAAQNAKVTDPMGLMFNNITTHPKVSQGVANWDSVTDTIQWDIGNIIEGTPATMSYIVKWDSNQKSDPNNLYPTNGTTTMNYTDVYGNPASKNFEVPKVTFGKGSILIKGYRVNAAGEPINDNNVRVDRPDQAALLYSDPFKQNGTEALDIDKSYSVTPKVVAGYQLIKGSSPENVTLTTSDPSQIIWFGYTQAPHTLKVEYKAGNVDLDTVSSANKIQGEQVDVQSKIFDGYTLKDVTLSTGSGLTNTNGHVTGDMPDQDTTITYNYEANAQTVRVKYLLEGTTQNVAPSTDASGVTGGKTTLTALDVAGYSVVGSTTNEYTFTADQHQEVIFYYTPAKQQVTVKYLEKGNNRELSLATVSDGLTGGTIQLDAKAIAGYQVDQAKITYSFTTDAKQEVVFYYTPAKQQVTVKYLEKGSNRELSPATVSNGSTGGTVQLDARAIAGYQVDQAKITYSFTADTKQEVIFHYTTLQQQVTVKYLEKGTDKELSLPMLVKGVTSEVIKLNAKKVPGYDVDQQLFTYTFSTNAKQEVIFYYTPVEQKVVVKYVEKGSLKELSPATVEAGATSKSIVLKAKAIAGYKAVQSAMDYTFNSNVKQEVVFYYTPEEQQVTVKYLEKGTNKELAPASVMRSKTSDKIKIEAKSISGYEVDQAVKTHTFTADANQEVIFYYTADKQKLTVKYLEKGTNKKLEAETTVAGVTSEIAKLVAKKIPGYQAEQSVIEHKFNANANQEEIFYYTASREKVLVKYLEKGTNKELKPATVAARITAETIKLDAAKIAGYQTDRATIAYTFSSNATQEVIFYYTPAKEQVMVKYLEKGTNRELASATGKKGNTGEKIMLQAASIPGYLVDEAVKTHTFTTNAKQEVIFYYTADKQKVTVKYVDKVTGRELAPETSEKGTTAEKIKLEGKIIAGYLVDQAVKTHTFTADAKQEVVFYYTADKQKLTVKYLEKGTNKKLEAETTVAGVTSEIAKLVAKKIPGYQAEQSVIEHKFNEDATQEEIFYYTAGKEKVLVKYLEKGTDKELKLPTSAVGVTGETIKLDAAKIPGYQTDRATIAYTFNSNTTQEVIFYYTPAKEQVIVKYLEQGTNKELATSTGEKGNTGEKIKLESKFIAGYLVDQAVKTHTFTADAKQEVIFYYTADKVKVTVKYLEKGTNKELEPATFTKGKTAETINLQAKSIAGYIPEQTSMLYTFNSNPAQEVIFYYTPVKEQVIVKYLEQGTNKVLEASTVEEGMAGEMIKLNAKKIAGYQAEQPLLAYTFSGDADQEVIFYYTAGEEKTIVKYLEQGTDKELAPVSVMRGAFGDIIKLLAETIPGYNVDKERKMHTFNSDANQEEDFYYTPNKETVTVMYLEKGTKKELSPSTFINGIIGETIKLDAEDIPGYSIVGNSVQNFTLNAEAHQVVVFLYSKNVPPVEKRTITVNYVDRVSNLALKEPTLYGGEAGKTIHLTAEPISVHSAVYDVVYAPENYDFNYLVTDVKVQNYTFYYNLDHSGDIQKVIVHHVYMDGDKKVELAVEEKQGKQGDTITMSPDLITKDGIVYRSVKDKYAYTFTSDSSQSYEIFYSIDEVPIEKEYQDTNNESANSNLPSGTTALPPVPVIALPPVPLKLEKEQHINYIKGYPDGMIKPENFISREEIAAIFYRLLDDESRSSYMKLVSSFKDVGQTRWSSRHIATLANAGVITGYQDGTFDPGQKITRAEFAAIASRFDKLDEKKNDMFSDIKGHWAEKYILSSANKGWIKGYQDGTFKPNQYITRAEAMAFINSVLDRKVKAEGIDEDAKQWPDNSVSKWYYADVMEATTNHLYTRDTDGFETWQEIKPAYVYPE
ncbi:MucBP domain-containing protein [Paenibacillus sp. FSL R10-2734]|uniref:MucBP domain-containing protein n=1 Tax=Paenibacillus sp. FSL R10-2734 TaxID=2954691 RepID=UPI0030D96603